MLSRHFDVKINMSENLNEMPLTGTFEQDRGIKEILDIVAAAIGASVESGNEPGSFALTSRQ